MNFGITNWAHLVALIILVLGFWVFVIRFLLRQGRKKSDQAIKDIQPHSANNIAPAVTVAVEELGNTPPAAMLREEIKSLLLESGVAIYAWERECYKCHKKTTVYSYYIVHDLKKVLWGNFDLDQYPEIGLGYIPSLDRLVAEYFPTASIRQQYSRSEGESYFANHCSHCDSLQGRYYVVDDPDEICEDLWPDDGDMEQYLVVTLPVPELIADEIADYIEKSVNI